MVNGYNNIYIEKGGKIIKSDKKFSDDEAVLKTIERIVTPLGRRIDESMPYVDARLPDGSRVNAIIPPLAIDGPTITIRKFSKKKLSADDLINFGSITKEAVEFLKEAVVKRKNILISGGTGSGKTTLLNILSSFIPSDERIITIEDSAELKLLQEHIVRLEARPANIEGKGEITIRDLVKNALRMRPDRIVVGECRGGETLDMLQAMNTGHEGSMTTVHANSPRDAISRLEVMVLMAGTDLPLKAIREQIKSAIDIIVQQARLKDGSRKVTYVSEITGMDGDVILMQNVFEFEEIGFKDNKIIGNLKRVDNIYIK
jgi:pilus assembly protein CpaF